MRSKYAKIVTMPTVLEIEGFRFFFYSADRNEPPHIHIRKAGQKAKFWLTPPEVPFRIHPAYEGKFKPAEIRRILEIIEENQTAFLEQWNEHFNS